MSAISEVKKYVKKGMDYDQEKKSKSKRYKSSTFEVGIQE